MIVIASHLFQNHIQVQSSIRKETWIFEFIFQNILQSIYCILYIVYTVYFAQGYQKKEQIICQDKFSQKQCSHDLWPANYLIIGVKDKVLKYVFMSH